jgi:hypothetical protein
MIDDNPHLDEILEKKKDYQMFFVNKFFKESKKEKEVGYSKSVEFADTLSKVCIMSQPDGKKKLFYDFKKNLSGHTDT